MMDDVGVVDKGVVVLEVANLVMVVMEVADVVAVAMVDVGGGSGGRLVDG